MPQTAQRGIGDGGVGENQLARCKSAGIVFADPGSDPEKRRLKPDRAAVRQVEPAGGVPPFGPKIGMRAVIGGKNQFAARQHAAKADCFRSLNLVPIEAEAGQS